MRFMVMHKQTEEMERGLLPDPEVMEAVRNLIQEGVKDRTFVSGEGLKPTSERFHIRYAQGQRTLSEGPFTDAKELSGGFTLTRVRSLDEALAWADKYAAVFGDVELFVGPVVEPWDLSLMPAPPNAPLRFLTMHQVTEREHEGPPDPELQARREALIAELKQAGVLQASGGLQSTRHGARIRYQRGKPTVLDGPFAESKELIAGYAIIEVPSKAAAIEWTLRFGEVVKVNELDVRLMER